MEVHRGPLVLPGMAADPQAEHEAAAGEQLERRGLLGHLGRLPQRQLQHAGAEDRPGRRRRRDGKGGDGLCDRAGPEQVVDGPQGVRTGRFGPAAEPGDVNRSAFGAT